MSMPETLRGYIQSAGSIQSVSSVQSVQDQPGFTTEEILDIDVLTDFDITGNLLDGLLQQSILTTDTLNLLHPLADDLTAAQLEGWLEDGSLDEVPAQPADEPDSLSLVPVWGETVS